MNTLTTSDIDNDLTNGYWQEAINKCKLLLDYSRDDHDIESRSRYAQFILDGIEAASLGKIDTALQCFSRATEIFHQFPLVYNFIGNLFLDSGDYIQAASFYRRCIDISSDIAFVWCNLGVSLLAQGLNRESIAPLEKATELQPDFAYAHASLGDAHLANDNPTLALQAYRTAHSLEPDNSVYAENLATLAIHFNYMDEAFACLKPLQESGTASPHGNYALGNILAAKGLTDDAIICFKNVIKSDPEYALAYNNIGSLLHYKNNFQEALPYLHRATELLPDYAPGWTNLGNVLIALGETTHAIPALQTSLALDDHHPDTHGLIGKAYFKQGRMDDAERHLKRALELNPEAGFFNHAFDLAVVLKDQGRWPEALAMSQKAVSMNPGFAEAHALCAFILCWQEKFDEAQAYALQALALNPDTDANIVLGISYLHQGKFSEAGAYFQKDIHLHPDSLNAYTNLLHTLGFIKETTPDAYLATAKKFGALLSRAATPYSRWHAIDQPDTLPIRVGIVSGDLLNHPVGYFIEGLLPYLAPDKIELVAFVSRQRDDELSRRIRPQFSEWHQVSEGNIAAAAEVMHAANLHILLDLNGHTAYNMLPAFAYRPAPVQASWLGYWASTGVAEMDYLIADPVSVPPSHQSHFTEQIWYLPDTRLCFTPPAGAPATVSPPPVLKNGYVTFGCFQRLSKLNDDVLSVWRQIFSACPNARLHLKSGNLLSPQAQQALFAQLSAHGFQPDQVHLESGSSREAYLRSYEQVDFMLDTFPFPGGTTTCEALWMGVPTLTLTGVSLLQRQGESLLTAAGLTDWIARSPQEYVNLACRHAANPKALAELRAGLRSSVSQSALFDAPRFARHLEQALIGMWQHGSARRRASPPVSGE